MNRLFLFLVLIMMGCTSTQIVVTPAPERVLDKDDTMRLDSLYCEEDRDCIAAQCCHPRSVVNRANGPNCLGVLCDDTCSGPLECGVGRPVCVDNACVIKSLTSF